MDKMVRLKKRVYEKMVDYSRYNFSQVQSDAFKVFFEISQEVPSLNDMYRISVLIPKCFFNVDCALYLSSEGGRARKICDISQGVILPGQAEEDTVMLSSTPYELDFCFLFPIRANMARAEVFPFPIVDGVFGMLRLCPLTQLSEQDLFYFEKYANRIGYNLHNRILARKNAEHINFIKNLVNDIGHNVIVPNMFFKAYLRRLWGKIKKNLEIEKEVKALLQQFPQPDNPVVEQVHRLLNEFADANQGIIEEYNNINKHYENSSLFLETLLRRSHFEQGRYVLEKRSCNFKVTIIDPQLNRVAPRLKERGIEINYAASGIPDAAIEVVADAGLISQVYANFLSNAVKYTRPVDDGVGNSYKYISYGMEEIKDFFSPGKNGIKLNLFSTGPHIPLEFRDKIFEEGFRGANRAEEAGTGHGLRFVKDVIDMHGGVVGYEPTWLGNNFYFVLPM
ncbi:MAG: HAMP domain-containing histidine kinase [Deltaproteobacteria bacterium]|nr:HAMP domain-containing histidine kinase [Deltaproteobacteria bacterium]